jgi:SMC interacting uncharacterized protein involved in chromosome segregation
LKAELENEKDKVKRRDAKIKTLEEDVELKREKIKRLEEEVDELKEEAQGQKNVERELTAQLSSKEALVTELKAEVERVTKEKQVTVLAIEPAVKAVLENLVGLGLSASTALEDWLKKVSDSQDGGWANPNERKKVYRYMKNAVVRDLRLFPKDNDDPESILDVLYGNQDDGTYVPPRQSGISGNPGNFGIMKDFNLCVRGAVSF